MLTPGKADDRKPLENKRFVERLSETLFAGGMHLITRQKKGVKGGVLTLEDMVLPRKRVIIETMNDELKNIAQIEYSRHRSLANFLSNTFAALSAYCLFHKKPSIDVSFSNSKKDRLPALF